MKKNCFLWIVFLCLVLSACSGGNYTKADLKNDLKTKDERHFIDAAEDKFRGTLVKTPDNWPEIYQENYCGYTVDYETNTIHVFVTEINDSVE